MRAAPRAKRNTSLLHEPVVFLIPQEPDILQVLCCLRKTEPHALTAPGQNQI